MFGQGSGYSEPSEVRKLYERIGRKHMSEAAASSGGQDIVDELFALRREITALRTVVAGLGLEIADLRKSKKK